MGKYTGIEVQSLSYEEVILTQGQENEPAVIPVKQIKIDLVISGTYYQILNFVNTIERVPRIIKIEDILVQVLGEDHDSLIAYIRARTFFEE